MRWLSSHTRTIYNKQSACVNDTQQLCRYSTVMVTLRTMPCMNRARFPMRAKCQTWSRSHSSARPLPDEQDAFPWRSTKVNNFTPKRKVAGVLPWTIPRSEPNRIDSTHSTVNAAEVPSAHNHVTDLPSPFEAVSPTTLRYTGDVVIPITSRLHIVGPNEDTPRGIWPVFRLMDESGEFRDPAWDGSNHGHIQPTSDQSFVPSSSNSALDLLYLRTKLTEEYPDQAAEIEASGLLRHSTQPYADTQSTNTLLRAHRQIVRLRTMDTILQNAQRQGRVSFYMTCTGEEAIHMGSASALENEDHIFAQYREHGLLMWRGFTLEQFTNQCFSNDRDLGKGRQMPIHYGSRAKNYHTVSSPLGTQLPQAVGAAYRLKLLKKPNVAICFFGDGCASTTDFHAALNFAATLSAPVIFFCRNNGYAISTPVTEQYAGDGIVSRAPGYGMAAIRVDGNDIFAVHAAVREAKAYALKHSAPVLIEAMTYRLGHHSTSDDSTRYRSSNEVEDFSDQMDPLQRFNKFLMRHGLLTEEDLNKMKEEERIAVLQAIKEAEVRPPPSLESMFEDVYKEVPAHLAAQMKDLKDHMARHPGKY